MLRLVMKSVLADLKANFLACEELLPSQAWCAYTVTLFRRGSWAMYTALIKAVSIYAVLRSCLLTSVLDSLVYCIANKLVCVRFSWV